MAYKTCEDCGSRIFEHGCVNCNESDYISMQEDPVLVSQQQRHNINNFFNSLDHNYGKEKSNKGRETN